MCGIMIDLTRATNCIVAMRENGTYRGERVGRVTDNFPGYRKGQIVLFSEEPFPSDSQLRMGEFMGMKQEPTHTITVESPMTLEQIAKQRAQSSLLTANGIIVNVPRGYVEEIKI